MTTKPARATIGTSVQGKNRTRSPASNSSSKTSNPTREHGSLHTLVIGNRPWEESRTAIARAWRSGKPEQAAHYNFESMEAAWELLNARRFAILKIMAGQGPFSIREIARRAGRDVRGVHSDVRLLYHSGIIDKTPDGRMILPYEVIRLDFTLNMGKAA